MRDPGKDAGGVADNPVVEPTFVIKGQKTAPGFLGLKYIDLIYKKQ